jgi:hypothetical protein
VLCNKTVRGRMKTIQIACLGLVVTMAGCKTKNEVMVSPNTPELTDGITLEYGDRTVLFPILNASVWHNTKGTLCIEIEGDWGDIDLSSTDGAYGPPMINAGWDHEKNTPIEVLSGSEILIPESYREDLQDHVSVFYLSEHFDIKDLRFRFGELTDGSIPVEFAAFSEEDPTGSNPDKGIKISGRALVACRQ